MTQDGRDRAGRHHLRDRISPGLLSNIDIRGRGGKSLQDEGPVSRNPIAAEWFRASESVHHVEPERESRSWGRSQLRCRGCRALHHGVRLQPLANKNARSLEPTREAYDDYVARIDSEMEKTVETRRRRTPTTGLPPAGW